MKTTASSFISSDLGLVCLVVDHNILLKSEHQDELKQPSYIILYCLQKDIKYNIPLLIIWNIFAIAYGEELGLNLSYEMLFTCIFNTFKVSLKDQPSLKSLYSMNYDRQNEQQHLFCSPSRRMQSGARDEVQEMDRDALAKNQPSEWITSQTI